MEGVYSWVQNIVCYLIFVTIITSLLPAGKYEKYLRLFAGCILILLVLSPLTGSLRLEEKINAVFRSISFENEAGELQGQLDDMEEKRLNQLISRYEEEASGELTRLAAEEGFQAQSVSVSINADSKSRDFGKVKKIEMKLKNESENPGGGKTSDQNTGKGSGEEIYIEEVTPIQITGENEAGATVKAEGKAAEAAGPAQAASGKPEPDTKKMEAGETESTGVQPLAEKEALRKEVQSFRQTVAGYYQMEEENVEIRLEN